MPPRARACSGFSKHAPPAQGEPIIAGRRLAHALTAAAAAEAVFFELLSEVFLFPLLPGEPPGFEAEGPPAELPLPLPLPLELMLPLLPLPLPLELLLPLLSLPFADPPRRFRRPPAGLETVGFEVLVPLVPFALMVESVLKRHSAKALFFSL